MVGKLLVLLAPTAVFGLVADPAILTGVKKNTVNQEIRNKDGQILLEGMEVGHGGHSVKFHRFDHRVDSRGNPMPYYAIVVGGNKGVGYETASMLAQMGAQVQLGCRDLAKCENATKKIMAKFPWGYASTAPKPLYLDSMASVREFADYMTNTLPYVDLLVYAGGANSDSYPNSELTKDGFEAFLQVNTLAPFLLSQKLLPKLRKAPSSAPSHKNKHGRIVYLSSNLNQPNSEMMTTGLNLKSTNHAGSNYDLSKFLLTQLAQEINTREFLSHGVSTFAVHPGRNGNTFSCFSDWMADKSTSNTPCNMTPEQGADTVMFAATDADVVEREDLGTAYISLGRDEPSGVSLNTAEWSGKNRTKFYDQALVAVGLLSEPSALTLSATDLKSRGGMGKSAVARMGYDR